MLEPITRRERQDFRSQSSCSLCQSQIISQGSFNFVCSQLSTAPQGYLPTCQNLPILLRRFDVPLTSTNSFPMSSATTPRFILRHTRFVGRKTPRRHASTQEAASNAASKTKETASNVQSKASQGLSKVSSSAGPAISGATQRVSGLVSRIGGRTGRLISYVECAYISPRAVRSPQAWMGAWDASSVPMSVFRRAQQIPLKAYLSP